MNAFNRITAQTIITALDLNHIQLPEARRRASQLEGFTSDARTRRGFIKDLCAAMNEGRDKP